MQIQVALVGLTSAAFTHSMWRYAPLKLVCQLPIKTKEEEEEQQCCCVHGVELLHLCRATQCRQEPHMSSLEWALVYHTNLNCNACSAIVRREGKKSVSLTQ